MNILVIGSGGREHALCRAIKKSPLAKALYCAPGNAGIAQAAECVELKSHSDIIAFCRENLIGLVVIGPEQPLVDGLSDALEAANINVFGPSAKAAQLEGSKAFTKHLCKKYNIPTGAYAVFTDAESAKEYVSQQGAPIVVKADGLAAGKGVVVAMSKAEARTAIDEMFDGRFGAAGASVVIEEFLDGEEASFFALCDGERAVEFCYAQDHKRAYDGDTGPNTGGMGSYSPAPVMTEALRKETMERIVRPTVQAMKQEGMPYKGVLFAGLMLTKNGPKLIEYNARFGDPETQVMLARLTSDIVPLLTACAEGKLDDAAPQFSPQAAVCVVMAARGYPGEYAKGSAIKGLDKADAMEGVVVFHAGTAQKDGQVIAAGGRVLGVTALGDTIAEARAKAYRAVDSIGWPEGFCRRDIARRAIGD